MRREVARDALALGSLKGSRLTGMTEEIAPVSSSTRRHATRVGRVNIIENQPPQSVERARRV